MSSAENPADAVACRFCGGAGYVSEHDPACFGNCERHGCPVQMSCGLCLGSGIEIQPAEPTPLTDEECPF